MSISLEEIISYELKSDEEKQYSLFRLYTEIDSGSLLTECQKKDFEGIINTVGTEVFEEQYIEALLEYREKYYQYGQYQSDEDERRAMFRSILKVFQNN
jgi:hypothetical protein